MKALTLPELPTTTDPSAFVTECDDALRVLIPMETRASNDLDTATARGLKKAAHVLRNDLDAIRARKKLIGVAKSEAVIAAQTAEAEKWEREADAALPEFESATAEVEAANRRADVAKRAVDWAQSRAELARARIDTARRERDVIDPAPALRQPQHSTYREMERTAEQELALIGRR